MKKVQALMKAALCAVLTAGILAAATACASSPAESSAPASSNAQTSSADSHSEEKVLKVGMECAYAPHNWTQTDDSNNAVPIANAKGQYANGYDVMMAQKLADSIGYKLEVYKVKWDGLIVGLQTDKINAIIAGMSKTEKRLKSIDFTDPYDATTYCALVKKGGKYENATSIDDFAGAKASSQLGTLLYDDLTPQLKGADVQPAMTDVPTILAALEADKIDVAPIDYPTALSATHTNPNLVTIQFAEGKGYDLTGLNSQSSIGVKKGDTELLDALNKALADITEDDMKSTMEQAVSIQPSMAG